jgi:hypothetical protein
MLCKHRKSLLYYSIEKTKEAVARFKSGKKTRKEKRKRQFLSDWLNEECGVLVCVDRRETENQKNSFTYRVTYLRLHRQTGGL